MSYLLNITLHFTALKERTVLKKNVKECSEIVVLKVNFFRTEIDMEGTNFRLYYIL